MKANIILTILAAMVMGIVGFVVGQTTAYNQVYSIIDTYKNYYTNTEHLLDTICEDTDSTGYFHDVLMTTDVYYEYEIAKDSVNSDNLWKN